MFRDPMASRKPQGILASSAPMMTAAQKAMAKNQPMKAQTGTSVNTGPTFFGQQTPGAKFGGGKYGGLKAADMRKSLMDFIFSQVQAAPGYQIFYGDTGRNIAQLAQMTAPVSTNPLFNPSFTADFMEEATKPGDYTALRQSMQEQLSPLEISLLESGIGGAERVKSLGRALLQGPIQAEKDFRTLTTRPSKLDMGEFEGLEDLPETPSLNLLPQSSSILQDDPALVEQEVIKPDITDTAVESGAEAQETAGESEAVKGTTGIDTSKLTQMLADHQAGESKVTPLNDQELFTPEAVKVAAMEIPKEATLSEIEKKYKDLFDYDPKQLEGDKKDAFWRNLTMAGLAMAAGESDNALTNIAKGAMVGLDAYGKEVGELTKADREAKREDRRTKLQLIQNENDRNIAMAQLRNQYNMDKTRIEQDAQQFGVTSALQQRQLQIDEGYKRQQGEIALVTALNDANYKREALQVQRDQLSLEQFKSNVANSSELAQALYPLGPEYATRDEEGNITINKEFLQQMEDDGTLGEYIDLAITGKEKSPTDTTLNAQAIAEQLGISLAQARTLITLGGGRLKEGVPIADVMAELDIVPGFASQTQATLSAADIQAHQAANAAAKATGAKTYTINGVSYNVQ